MGEPKPDYTCFTCVYGTHTRKSWKQEKCNCKSSPYFGKVCKNCTKSKCDKYLWCWSKKGRDIYLRHIANRPNQPHYRMNEKVKA